MKASSGVVILLVFIQLSAARLKSKVLIPNPGSVFTIVGPKVVRNGESYQCVVTNHDLASSVRLKISLSYSANSSENVLSKTPFLQAGETKLINFEVKF